MSNYLTRLKSGETGRRFGGELQLVLVLSTALLLIFTTVALLFPRWWGQALSLEIWLCIMGAGIANLIAVVIAIVRLAREDELRVPWNYILLAIAGGWWAVFLMDWLQFAGSIFAT